MLLWNGLHSCIQTVPDESRPEGSRPSYHIVATRSVQNLITHCLPYIGTLLSLGLLFYSLLFPFAIDLVPIVPGALLFVSLGHLVMVAALVVYKPSLYHRRGLKPDLVS